jgi:PAS domain S-box-containing protein
MTTILTIDDEGPLRLSIREYLEDYDYNVLEAEDGLAGQEIFREKKPDLVLVDLRMPKVNGLEVLKFMREKSPETPVIVISGTGQISSIVEALHLGAWDYILKPILDMTVLLHSVKKALERARMIRENRLHREHLETEVTKRTKEIKLTNETLNHEIEERKRAENEIKRTKNYLDNVFNSISSMLIAIDGTGSVTQWNLAAETFTGIPMEQAISKKLWGLAPFLGEYKTGFEEMLRTREPKEWHKVIFPNEGKKHLHTSMSPLAFEGDDGAVIQVEDITELKVKDEQLRQAQKMETVGILAGGLAHDINNVLGGIIGPLSIIQSEMDGDDISPKALKKYLRDIDKSANRAADIVKHLLALSRKEENAFEVVDLNQVIRHVIRICQNTFDKRVELDPVFSKRPAQVFSDPAQIEQVVLNLCVNAHHAMTIMRQEDKSWGGRLTIALKRFNADEMFCQVHPEARIEEYWKLSVEDSGVGIKTRTISKIFSPFFTTKSKNKGTGLGLSMVYNIIKFHKGFVSVYSEIDKGTIFHVYLPALSQEILEDKKRPVLEEHLEGSGLILVVEDEPIMRGVALKILKSSGYDVIMAQDGAEAIPLFKKHHQEIRLVLLDMLMPKKSGKEAYIEMRKINPDLKVLLNSGFRRDEMIEEVMKLGVSDFLEKPYTKMQLLRAVHNILQR